MDGAEKTEKSKRDLFLERLLSGKEGRSLENDEEIFGAAMEDIDGLHARISEYDGSNQKILEAIKKDPRVANFLENLITSKNDDGYGIIRSLTATFGSDIKDAMDSEDMMKEIAERANQEIEKASQSKELQKKQDENLEAWIPKMDAYFTEKGLSEDDKLRLVQKMVDVQMKLFLGEFEEEILEMFYKAMAFDTAVEEAKVEGRVAANNERIDLRMKKEKDEIPTLNSSGDIGNSKPIESTNKKSAWDIGRSK